MKIPKPWSPVKVTKSNGKVTVDVWGRSYTAGNSSILESIVSQNQEILSSPIRIVGIENGEPIKWDKLNNFVMADTGEDKAVICSSCQSSAFVLNTSMAIEYDGCIELGLSVMPQGRSVNEWFGLGEHKVPGLKLEKLWMEIPFRTETSEFYQFFPKSDITVDGELIEDDAILQSGFTPKSMQMPFKEQVYICNDDVGFGVFFESDKDMQFEDENCAMEIIRNEEETLLRIHLLDSEPQKWLNKGPQDGKHLFPITYKIGLMATPVRQFPDNPYAEHNMHMDAFKKIPENYEEFLMSPFEDTDEIAFDRYKRLGVNVLYIHEKWNDIQNSPFITEETSERLKLIVKEAHKRGIKVIPYFGYEIASLSPLWSSIGEDIMRKPGEEYYDIHWYRYPWQRDLIVCYNSKWQDIFVSGIEKLMDEYGFDGIYLDGTIRPMSCTNEAHGCGYRDKDGHLHATYPVWAVREVMKKLYAVVEKRGGIINSHGSAAFTLGTMPYCHSQVEGEMIQAGLLHGKVKEFPEGHFRSIFQGRNLGMPVYMTCYTNPPTWKFSQTLSLTFPLGILPKQNDSGEPLEIISDVWQVLDKFNFKNAKWHPYYNNDFIKSDSDAVKVSYYENNGKYLLMIANTKDTPCSARITADDKIKLNSFSSSCDIEFGENEIIFKANNFDYALIYAQAK